MRKVLLAASAGLVSAGLVVLGLVAESARMTGRNEAAASATPIPYEQDRREGRDKAERDMERGRPRIRRLPDARDGSDVESDGIGIDRETGLGLWNTMLMCGTGVDFEAYHAEIEACNDRILAAHAAGRFDRFRLDHKLRTLEEVRVRFAGPDVVRLAKGGDSLEIADGQYTLT